MFCHKPKELTPFQAGAQYKALEGGHTPHQQIYRVNSTHRTDLKGVNFISSASKTRKLCVAWSSEVLYSEDERILRSCTVGHKVVYIPLNPYMFETDRCLR